MADWRQWLEDGLTQHRNWWPDLYRAYCEKKGIKPDPEVLDFHETYESKRADLKGVAVSG